MKTIDHKNKLEHIAIIMDGNGRWATKQHLPRSEGHKKGVKIAKKAIQYCLSSNVKYLTLYTFSKENWLRPADEVNLIMDLLKKAISQEEQFIFKNDISLKIIGELTKIPKLLRSKLDQLRHATRNNKKMTLIIALDYSAKWEIINATKNIAKKYKEKGLNIDDIDETIFEEHLKTFNIPDPDLLIRTGGTNRLSNFLLWQLSYTEIIFSDVLWPEFSEVDLEKAVNTYIKSERRFGLTSEQIQSII